jgi:syntaxin-binding protein 1
LQDFREVRIDFQAVESRLALFGRRNTIPALFFPTSERQRTVEVDRTAQQLASLCVCLKELPYIRYNENANGLSAAIAERFESHIQSAARELPDWKYNDMRATLLIVDRSVDPIAPLMHEYTYQAMVNDVLNVDGQIVTLSKVASGSSEDSKGPFLLDDEEDLYKEMRHQHISEVTQNVTQRFNNFKTQNATAKLQGTDDVKEMLAVAKALPQYRAEMKKYTKHMTLAEACFDAFDERKLREVSHVEQDMATGVDEEGNKTTKKQLQERLVEKIQSRDIRTLDKLRLLMIYIISQDGIDVATRKHLFGIANFTAEQEEAVQNLVSLGVTLQSVLSLFF